MSGSCTVTPGYHFSQELVNDAKLNMMGSPVVQVNAGSITDRELDYTGLITKLGDALIHPNYFFNGNFDLPFWDDGLGAVTASNGTRKPIAHYWACAPLGGNVTVAADTAVAQGRSYFSAKITGNAGVGEVDFGQDLPAWIGMMLRTQMTFSVYVLNQTGLAFQPQVKFSTPNAQDDFSTVTLQQTLNLQTCQPSASVWTRVTVTIDLTNMANITNGLRVEFSVPAGFLNQNTEMVNLSLFKLETGAIATAFVYEPADLNRDWYLAGGRTGYRTTALTNANVTLTALNDKKTQAFTGALTGPVVINVTRAKAWEGAEFFLNFGSLVVTATNTLTLQENGAGSLLVWGNNATLTGIVRVIYTGTAWVVVQQDTVEQ